MSLIPFSAIEQPEPEFTRIARWAYLPEYQSYGVATYSWNNGTRCEVIVLPEWMTPALIEAFLSRETSDVHFLMLDINMKDAVLGKPVQTMTIRAGSEPELTRITINGVLVFGVPDMGEERGVVVPEVEPVNRIE